MALSPGDKLGPYEIVLPIGAGGMGEVYKAHDTRLDRTVAIKVLPEHIAKREDLRARFEREARAVASLNHPHICTLHDIGTQDGAGYMVMEFMEGETLAARIEKGALPLEQALKFATQIADALDRAHRAGVTHRDVKPQNIMLTRDGVKVLDFGLAKSVASKAGPTEATLTNVLTTEGTVMGTPQYMAPEQFEGKEADARSDIWAFGAVLYEMVTGRKAFEGKSYSSLVGAILATDPAPMAVQPFTPAWLERLVRRCLQKDPENRCQTMREVVLDLSAPPEETVAATAAKAGWWPWAAGAFGLAFVVAAVLLHNATRPAPPRPLLRLHAEASPDSLAVRGVDSGHMLALSPDGTRLAITMGGADGKTRLYTRLLHQGQVSPLLGTEDANFPFFSPDGEWIGFFAGGKLKKISTQGGAVVTLCDARSNRGGSWGDDGNIIAALDGGSGLSRVPSTGGTPTLVTKLNPGEVTHRWPQVLPGSQAVLFTASKTRVNYNTANVDVVSLRTGERKTIQSGAFSPRYLPTSSVSGHLIHLHQSVLFATPFDPNRLAATGPAAPILEDVGSNNNAGGFFSFAANGTFAYLPGEAVSGGSPIFWVDGSGKTAPLHTPSGSTTHDLRLSPDGKRLAFSNASGPIGDIWVKDVDRDIPSRLSFLAGSNSRIVWTPNGRAIVFRSLDPAAPGLYALRSDGAGGAKRLTDGTPRWAPSSFSPDGKRLAAVTTGKPESRDIFTFPVEADSDPSSPGVRLGKPEPFVATPFVEESPEFSPDGRWLAYSSNESGTNEVYVRPFPGPGGRWQVSTGGGRNPLWSRGSPELLFESNGRVMSVSYVVKGDSFVAGKSRLWTEVPVNTTFADRSFDLTPDGKRLAVILSTSLDPEKPPTHLTFLLNFFDELRRKAPVGK